MIRVHHLEKSWIKAGKWGGIFGICEILKSAEDECNVAGRGLERHLAKPPGADEAAFICLTLRVRYILRSMLALGRRMSQYEVSMQCNTRGIYLQHDISVAIGRLLPCGVRGRLL